MACKRCSENGKFNDMYKYKSTIHVCPSCSQRWWCYDMHNRLWGRIEDDLTWDNILNGCPLSIKKGNPSVVLEEFIPKNYARPDDVCPEKVQWARLSVVDSPSGKAVAVQWTGEYEIGNIFSHQFNFHINCRRFFGCDSPGEVVRYYSIIYLGKTAKWPQREYHENLLGQNENGNRSGYIVHLVSGRFVRKYPNGIGPSSLALDVAIIADQNAGIIRPLSYCNPSAMDDAMDAVREDYG
jgi:hypothetical protein